MCVCVSPCACLYVLLRLWEGRERHGSQGGARRREEMERRRNTGVRSAGNGVSPVGGHPDTLAIAGPPCHSFFCNCPPLSGPESPELPNCIRAMESRASRKSSRGGGERPQGDAENTKSPGGAGGGGAISEGPRRTRRHGELTSAAAFVDCFQLLLLGMARRAAAGRCCASPPISLTLFPSPPF